MKNFWRLDNWQTTYASWDWQHAANKNKYLSMASIIYIPLFHLFSLYDIFTDDKPPSECKRAYVVFPNIVWWWKNSVSDNRLWDIEGCKG